jgi:hypothetical protein
VSADRRTSTVADISLIQEFGLGASETLSLDETNGAMLATTPLAGEHCTVVVSLPSDNDAVETVAWLLRWCPHQARAFALAMHERAAWPYDDSRTGHWRHVLGLLPRNYVASAGRHFVGRRGRSLLACLVRG